MLMTNSLKHPYFNGGLTVYSTLKENLYQNGKFSTEFPTLKKDFSELRKFQPKPFKTQLHIGLKSSNPEGFWITLKTLEYI